MKTLGWTPSEGELQVAKFIVDEINLNMTCLIAGSACSDGPGGEGSSNIQ